METKYLERKKIFFFFYNFFTFHYVRHQIEERSGISFNQAA